MDFDNVDFQTLREYEPKIRHLWHDYHLSLGLPIIDIQHLWLVFILVCLDSVTVFKEPHERLSGVIKVLDQLHRYASEHFAAEFALTEMLDFKAQEHKREHQNFLKHAHDLLLDFRALDASDNRTLSHKINELQVYTRDWVMGHIAITDRDPIIYLRRLPTKQDIIAEWIRRIRGNGLLQIRKPQKMLYDIIERNVLYFADADGENLDALSEAGSQSERNVAEIQLDQKVLEFYSAKARHKNMALPDYINLLLKRGMLNRTHEAS